MSETNNCPSSPTGVHYWLIDTNGLHAVCKYCPAERQYEPIPDFSAKLRPDIIKKFFITRKQAQQEAKEVIEKVETEKQGTLVRDFRTPSSLSDEARKIITGRRDEMIADATAPAVPPKPKGARRIGRYYDENRKDIEADIEALGKKEVLKKWGISGGAFTNLRRRWQSADAAAKSTVFPGITLSPDSGKDDYDSLTPAADVESDVNIDTEKCKPQKKDVVIVSRALLDKLTAEAEKRESAPRGPMLPTWDDVKYATSEVVIKWLEVVGRIAAGNGN